MQHTPLVLPALQSATANLAFPMFNLKPNLVQRYHVWRYHLTFTSSGMWAAPWGMSLLATTQIGWEQADPSRSFPVWLYTPTTRRIFLSHMTPCLIYCTVHVPVKSSAEVSNFQCNMKQNKTPHLNSNSKLIRLLQLSPVMLLLDKTTVTLNLCGGFCEAATQSSICRIVCSRGP